MKAAWFLSHRIREAMHSGDFAPMSGLSGIVEADETYFGQQEERVPSKQPKGRAYTKRGHGGPGGKRAIVSLVERGGSVRSFHFENADKATVNVIITGNIAREARLHTDESHIYGDALRHVVAHETVRHSAGEYVWGDVYTNSAEGFFSISKRGMRGIYQRCREKHLHRYLAEFDYRYNHRIKLGFNDADRLAAVVRGAEGKRLTYHQPHGTHAVV